MMMRTFATLAAACLIAAVVVIGNWGCDRAPPPPPAKGPEPKHIVSSVYPVADIARQIGGKRVTVQWFIESGQPLTEVEGILERRNAVRTADLIINRGPHETWMLGGADDPFGARRIIRLETFPSAQSASPQAHLWLDPNVARELSIEIAKRLAAVEPGNEAYFQENLKKFQREMDAICDDARAKLAKIPQKHFLCTSAGFSTFVLRFGIDEALAAVEPSEALAPQRLRGIRTIAGGLRASALFVPDDIPPGIRRDISSKVGVPVLTLDPLGTSAPSGRSTYLQLLRYNLDQLIAGVGDKS